MPRSRRIPEDRVDPLIIEVWPHRKSGYKLYEDEGVTEFICDRGEDRMTLEWTGPLSRRMILHFKEAMPPRLTTLITNEEPEKTQELEGLMLDRTYVLAIPETAGARVTMFFAGPGATKRR